ncbi:MAG TPA: nitroreductase [Steroidobacteraceae bacterium]
MQAIDALLRRRSARLLAAPAPDAAAIELILESAMRAPDHGGLRPWRFTVIQGEGLMRLGELFAESVRRHRDPITPEELERARRKALRAPLVIAVAAVIQTAVRIPAIEQILSAGAAAQNMLLAAFVLGYNAVWKTGAPAYDDEVKAAFGLAPKDAIVGFLYVGSEECAPKPGPRPAVREFTQIWQ